MEEDDEILDINIDPFSEEWVQPFEELDEPPPEERLKPPPPEEKSEPKQCSLQQWLIMEEDDEILDINIDPFSEEWIQPFEEQDENKAAEGQNKEQDKGLSGDEAEEETNHSSQENCF